MKFSPALPAVLVAGTLACAAHREPPLPTLEDYSDGVSGYAGDFLEDWKTGSGRADLYDAGFQWSGPLPGESLAVSPSRPPLSVRVFRGGAQSAPHTAAELRAALAGIRRRFASLARTESVLFDFRRRGPRREILLGVLLTGRGGSGELVEESGKIRALLRPDSAAGRWRMESASLADWVSASAAEPLFEETARRAGLSRVHRAFLPNAPRNIPVPGEHMPPGAAVLDFDGDGREDLFVAGGDGNRLYRNRGDGVFEDVTAEAGVGGQRGEATGALGLDYDGDGRPDLYVSYLFRPNLLYRNRGDGTFEEVAHHAGVDVDDYCTSAAALDYDRDGRPDLYVLVYGRPGRGPDIGAKNAPPNRLFHNNGDGTFTDVTKQSGAGDTGWGLAVESADLDGDGWPDLYVANDFGNNAYLHNERDGTFRNRASRAGILDPGFGMGVAIDDYDGDGRLDLYVSNYSFPMNWFLRDPRFPMPQFPYSLGRPLVWRRLKLMSRGSSLFRPSRDGSGRFERTSVEADVWDTSWSWGCVWIDADLDGLPDLFVVNGMVTGKNAAEHEIDFWNLMSAEYKKFEQGIPTGDFGDDSLWGHEPKRFYRNLDGRHFAELAAVTGLESDANQRALVVLDANGDGAPDLFATGFLQPPALWINRNPSRANSLVVTLQGDPSGPGPYRSTREALGAIVTVEAGGWKRAQVVAAGYSFLSSGSRSLFFGLGQHDEADRVVVRWPSGRTTLREHVPHGRLMIEEETDSR